MPGKYFDYYAHLGDRLLPFLQGRRVAIEQRFPSSEKSVYRRHSGAAGEKSWICIDDRAALLEWVRTYAEGFHAHIRAEGTGAWFVIDIDSRDLATEMARLGAVHANAVLKEQGIAPLVKFSGSDGYHLMLDVAEIGTIPDAELWELERGMVRSVACEVERRLGADPDAQPIRDAVGAGRPLVTTSSIDRENSAALLFDEYILKDNATLRAPYSVHPTTGLVSVPIPESELATFKPKHATTDAVIAGWQDTVFPSYALTAVREALKAWRNHDC